MNIKATLIRKTALGNLYLIQGAPTNPEWLKNLHVLPGEAWCEVTIARDGWISSFGGEVWPGAWPEFFTSVPNNNYACGSHGLTPAGQNVINAAS